MKRFACIILIAFTSLRGYAQHKIVTLKFAPLALIDDISFPTIQAGIEYHFAERVSWYSEAGIKYRRTVYDKDWDTSFVSAGGFKLKTELRYYLDRNPFFILNGGRYQNFAELYLGINLFYASDAHNNGVHYYTQNGSPELTDVFGVNKTVYGSNAVIGVQKFLSKRIGVDGYAGLGIKFRHIETSHKEFIYGVDQWITPIDWNIQTDITQAEVKGGNSITGNFTLGFRLCYRL